MIREMKTLNNINLLSPSCWKELFVLLTIFFSLRKVILKTQQQKNPILNSWCILRSIFSRLGFAMVPLWEQYVYVISLFCRQVTRFLGEEGQPLLRPELQENCWRALTALKPFSCGWGCASWLWDNIRLGQLPLPHISWFPWCVSWMCRRKLQHLLGRTYSG